jgi:hypothetical protein
MKRTIPILLLYFLLISPQKIEEYPLKKGKPTSRGIDYYVKTNKDTIQKELEVYLKDTIFLFVEMKTDDISNYTDYDSLDVAYHFTYTDGSDEIIIDNRERYVAYDIDKLSKLKKLNLNTYNQFVKTAIIHELMHTYFLQQVIIARHAGFDVYKEYDYTKTARVRMFPNIEEQFGAEFIEEGVCQYVVEQMKQQIPHRTSKPETANDIMGNNEIKYGYSVDYLKQFLDYIGVRKGIGILIQNKPPIYQEILNSDLFFNRIN